MRPNHLKRHSKTHAIVTKPLDDTIRARLLANNEQYLQKLETGREIWKILDEGVVMRESLLREHNQALALYFDYVEKNDIELL